VRKAARRGSKVEKAGLDAQEIADAVAAPTS
jgi:hypothetical protein